MLLAFNSDTVNDELGRQVGMKQRNLRRRFRLFKLIRPWRSTWCPSSHKLIFELITRYNSTSLCRRRTLQRNSIRSIICGFVLILIIFRKNWTITFTKKFCSIPFLDCCVIMSFCFRIKMVCRNSAFLFVTFMICPLVAIKTVGMRTKRIVQDNIVESER